MSEQVFLKPFMLSTTAVVMAVLVVGETAELSETETQIGENFEILAANDPDGRDYMQRFSDPDFFNRTRYLDKVWGSARVLDGQTLEISGETIRLFGIEAPDISQVCKDEMELQFDAGGFALSRLKAKAPPDKAVVCYLEPDLNGVGSCFVWGFPGPINIARVLVREGAAWARPRESNLYIRDEGWAEGAASKDDNPPRRNLWHTDCSRAE